MLQALFNFKEGELMKKFLLLFVLLYINTYTIQAHDLKKILGDSHKLSQAKILKKVTLEANKSYSHAYLISCEDQQFLLVTGEMENNAFCKTKKSAFLIPLSQLKESHNMTISNLAWRWRELMGLNAESDEVKLFDHKAFEQGVYNPKYYKKRVFAFKVSNIE